MIGRVGAVRDARSAFSRWTLALALVTCAGCTDGPGDLDVAGGDARDELRELFISSPPASSTEAGLLARPRPTLRDVLLQLRSAAEAESARGVFLRVGPLAGAWGRAGDITEALAAVREAGKPLHCHFEVADNVAYLLMASVCDRITMTPAGTLDLVGPSMHLFYARSLLDTLGIKAEMFHAGRYKGAADIFTEEDIPESSREALMEVVDDLHQTLRDAVARRVGADKAEAAIDEGPYVGDQASIAKLIDDVEFDDEARAHARLAAAAAAGLDAETLRVRRVELLPPREEVGLTDVLRALSGSAPAGGERGARLVVAHLDGTIADSEDDAPAGGQGSSQSGPFVAAMRRFADDDDVKAVVLRIDSPGGSALASDRMWHSVRRLAGRKKVVVSIGDMAASGGYYVASAGSEIFAHSQSLIGSIGVVGGKMDLSGAGERLGIRSVVLHRGRHAAWLSPTKSFGPEERRIFQAMLWRTYDRFLRRVAEGRSLSREEVEKAAEGRVFTAKRGKSLGLVDQLGGLEAAIARARQLAELPDDVRVVEWPRRRSMLESIGEALGAPPPQAQLGPLLKVEGVPEAILHARDLVELLSDGDGVALLLPFALVVR